jgi:hypothetical protein
MRKSWTAMSEDDERKILLRDMRRSLPRRLLKEGA